MVTSSTKRLLLSLALTGLVAGCVVTPQDEHDVGFGTDGQRESRYAEQRQATGADLSDAEHVPPVPHDPALRGMAQVAAPEYARAIQMMLNNELDKALILFKSIATRYPEFSGPVLNQAFILHRQDKPEEALLAAQQALTINDKNPYAHNFMGLLQREQGQFQEARKHLQTALTLDPKYARAHFNLAVLSELYLLDNRSALEHFRSYQNLQRQEDRTVANWIIDLERRVSVETPAPTADDAEGGSE